MEHLVERVREVEGCAAINLVARVPIRGRDDALVADARFDAIIAGLGYLAKNEFAVAGAFPFPIHVRVLVRDGREHVKRAVAARRKTGVGDAGVLYVKAGIIAQDMLVLDVIEVFHIVLRDVDGVVWELVTAFDAEIHHEGRAGIFLLRQLLVRPAMTQAIGNQILHGPGEISVHHHGIGGLGAARRADSDRASAGEEDFFNRFVEADFHTEALRDAGHGSGDRGASANRMINAVFVFEEAQDAK